MKPRPAAQLLSEKWGQQIVARRQRLEMTQGQLAEATTIDQGTLSRIENGRYRSLTPDLLLRIAVALDEDPARLFEWPFGIGMIAQAEMAA